MGSDRLLGAPAAGRTRFAIANKREEELLEGSRRMFDRQQLALMPGDDLTNLFDAILGQALRANLRDIGLREQAIDAAELFQLALVQNRDAVANVLHVREQMAAHDDRFALIAQAEDHVLHFARADRVEAARR